jgi:Zn-dependent protease with chaperone function
MNSTLPDVFPPLKFDGPPINPREYIEKGTGAAKAAGMVLVALAFLVLIIGTYGIGLIALPIGWLADYFNQKKAMAKMKGSAIEVGPDQFPELHECAVKLATRLGLKQPPAIYIVENRVLNAVAMRIGSRQVIALMDDVVDACLRSGDPRTIGFILAHEMAHHALGHTSRVQAYLAINYKKLSRLNEFTSDAVARALVGEPQIAAQALMLLLTGPQLIPYVNIAALLCQAKEVDSDKNSVRAEKRLSHPLLLRRLQRMLS